MRDLKEQREEIMRKLESLTSEVTNDVIKEASTEDLKKYLKLMTEITLKLIAIDNLEE